MTSSIQLTQTIVKHMTTIKQENNKNINITITLMQTIITNGNHFKTNENNYKTTI